MSAGKTGGKKSGAKKKITFEKALEQLEEIVRKMESGELSLEDSLKLFQDGIEHSKTCRELLAEAEYRVEHLLKEKAAEETAGMEDEDNDDEGMLEDEV